MSYVSLMARYGYPLYERIIPVAMLTLVGITAVQLKDHASKIVPGMEHARRVLLNTTATGELVDTLEKRAEQLSVSETEQLYETTGRMRDGIRQRYVNLLQRVPLQELSPEQREALQRFLEGNHDRRYY